MSSQHHLKETLRELGYFPSDESEIPDIPMSCLTLVTTLVDDLSHSQSRISRLQAQITDTDDKLRDLDLHLSSSEVTANKLADDNQRLRGKLLALTTPSGDEDAWQQEKLVELQFLLGEYKKRCASLTEALETTGAGGYQGEVGEWQEELDSLKVTNAQLQGRVEELEGLLELREEEIDSLETMLGKRVVANISDPAARLIFLEEHCRNLEQMGLKGKAAEFKTDGILDGKDYETMRAEIMTYKQQRDSARDKAARYKSQLLETLEELQVQTEKFELLAEEFRRIIKLESIAQ